MTARKVLLVGDDPFSETPALAPFRFSLADHAAAVHGADGLELAGLFAPAPALLERARAEWGVEHAAEALGDADVPSDIDMAVLLTGPQHRADLVQQLHGVGEVMVETPCGLGVADSEAFMDLCETNAITATVSGAWRTDPIIRALYEQGLETHVGTMVAATGIYGFGLWDRGVMWLDLVSLLLGPISMVQALEDARAIDQPALDGDQAASFLLTSDLEYRYGQVMVTALAAADAASPTYLEFIGAEGRLHLTLHRDQTELSIWRPDGEGDVQRGSQSAALQRFYAQWTDAAATAAPGNFSLAEAVETETLVETILDSADHGGDRYYCR